MDCGFQMTGDDGKKPGRSTGNNGKNSGSQPFCLLYPKQKLILFVWVPLQKNLSHTFLVIW